MYMGPKIDFLSRRCAWHDVGREMLECACGMMLGGKGLSVLLLMEEILHQFKKASQE